MDIDYYIYDTYYDLRDADKEKHQRFMVSFYTGPKVYVIHKYLFKVLEYTVSVNSKKKIPLISVNIPCFLDDMVRLTAPVINQYDQYYLSRPNGESIKLDIKPPNHWDYNHTRFGRTIVSSFIKVTTSIGDENTYSVFKSNQFDQKFKELAPNDFIVGPLLEEDYGNWVLSIYTKDINDEWIEMFQVFTMAITEFILLEPSEPKVVVGDTLNLSFPFPYPGIETCEIMAPRSTFDRFYNRSFTDFKKCGFTIPNITMDDAGTWTIIGFGRIIYQGDAILKVIDRTNSSQTEETNTTNIE